MNSLANTDFNSDNQSLVCVWLVKNKSLAECANNLNNIAISLHMYANDHLGHLPEDLGHLTPSYLRTLPVCPAAPGVNYVYSRAKDDGVDLNHLSTSGREAEIMRAKPYTVTCGGSHHADVGLGADLPKHTNLGPVP